MTRIVNISGPGALNSGSNKWSWPKLGPDQWPNVSSVTHTVCWPFKSKAALRKQTLFSDLFVEWSLELDQNCLWKPTHNHGLSSYWNQGFFPWEHGFAMSIQQRNLVILHQWNVLPSIRCHRCFYIIFSFLGTQNIWLSS